MKVVHNIAMAGVKGDVSPVPGPTKTAVYRPLDAEDNFRQSIAPISLSDRLIRRSPRIFMIGS
jgi:hypothetical protein